MEFCSPSSGFRGRSRLRQTLWIFAAWLIALGSAAAQQPSILPSALANAPATLTIRADSQEKNGELFSLKGNVVVTYRDMKVTADEASYDQLTGEVVARGHVTFTDPSAFLSASEAHYNVKTGKGWFLNSKGYVHPHIRPKLGVMHTENPFYVQAKVVERLNEAAYKVTDGRVTSCPCPQNGWALNVGSATVEPGAKLVAHNTVFHFLRMPVFYLPFVIDSIAPRPRQSGILLPSIGNSSQKGFMFGDGFYWAINRSADLTMGFEDYSKRGLGGNAEFRARPSADSKLDVNFFGVNDQGIGPSHIGRVPGESILAVGEADNLWNGFRGVVNVDYASSLAFRETFTNNFTQAVTSEARQMGFLTKNWGAYSANFYIQRYQNFLSTAGGAANSITIRQTPSFLFSSMDQQIRKLPVYFSFESSAGSVARGEPGFHTPSFAGRFDAHPELTLRLHPLRHLHITPSGGLRATHYGTSLKPDQSGLNRVLGDVSVDIRPPSLERVFSKSFFGYRLKHVIEPDIKYRLVSSPDPQEILDLVRFDALDTLTETNEIDYSLTNSIIGRKGSDSQARDLISLTLSQRYYFDPTFGGALQPGRVTVFEPTDTLTGFAFAQGRRLSPVVSVLKIAPSSNYDTELRADFDPTGGVLNAGITSGIHSGDKGLSLTDFFISRTANELMPFVPAIPLSQIPSYNLLRALATYGNMDRKGFSGAFGVDYNFVNGVALQAVTQVGYRFSCFAVDMEYRRFALGTIRRENEFRVAVSLANVGTIGNFRQNARLY